MLINNKSLIKTINKLNLTDDEREKFDKFGEDNNGNFLYNGKPVTGGATAEQAAQIEANKTAINKLTPLNFTNLNVTKTITADVDENIVKQVLWIT